MSHLLRRAALLLAAWLLALLISSQSARAAVYTWDVASGNWTDAGNWAPSGGPPTTGDTGTISSGDATINAALVGTPDIFVDGMGRLLWSTLAGPATGGTITVGSGGLLQYNGNTTNATEVVLEDGARFGKFLPWTATTTSADNFTIAAGATVAADAIRAHVPQEGVQRLQLTGSLSGGLGATLEVKPGLYSAPPATTGAQGELRIAPLTPNSFVGTVEVSGLSAGQRGILAVAGIGALENASLTLLAHGTLRFAGGQDPFAPAASINVPTDARVEWEGATAYNVAAPTLVLADGSQIGKYSNWTSVSTSRENLSIQSGATVRADAIRSHVPLDSNQRLQLLGQISGDTTTKIVVTPNLYTGDTLVGGGGQGQLRIAPTAGPNPFAGTIEVAGLSADKHAILALGGIGAVANATLSLQDHVTLIMAAATDPFGTSAASLNFNGTHRLLWEGASTYTNAPTFNLGDGARIGKFTTWTGVDTINETLSIDSGATVFADFIRSHEPINSNQRLQVLGQLVGDATTKIVVKPNQFTGNTFLLGGGQGEFRIAPTAANTNFFGTIEVEGLDADRHGIIGLAGTGALVNGNLDLGQFATLIIASATDPFGTAAKTLAISGDNRVFWQGASLYTGSPMTLELHDGAQIGRHTNWTTVDTSRENWHLVSGATVYADAIRAHHPGQAASRLQLLGELTGDATTTLVVEPGLWTGSNVSGGVGQGVLRIAPADPLGNASFEGHVRVGGLSPTQRGYLELGGAAALGSGHLTALAHGTVVVTTDGALDGATSVTIHEDAILRLQRNAASTLADTTLRGNGVVRAESTSTNFSDDTALRALTLNNVVIEPGLNNAGKLTFQTTQLTLANDSLLRVDLGGLSNDLIEVEGDLVLDSSSQLEINLLSGLTTGFYTIATYTGSLTGEFGTVINNLPDRFILLGIDYGSVLPNTIGVQLALVPEPGSATLFILAMLAATPRRRRQR